jgi:hypothetical protein
MMGRSLPQSIRDVTVPFIPYLVSVVARAAGLDPDQLPEDAEISPDLLDALASQKLAPEDIAIYRDEATGRPVIKSRQELAEAMGGVAEGHIYVKGERISLGSHTFI